MDSNPGPCTYLDFSECHLAVILWKTFAPVLLLVGVCGNVISFAVWSRKRMRRTTTSVYLRFLAVVDTTVLFVAPLRELIFYITHDDIQEVNDLSCKIHTWLAFSVSATSAWILSVLAIDRLTAVKFPIWTKSRCSKTIAVLIGCSLTIMVFLINSHMLVYLSKTEIRISSNKTNETLMWDVSCQPSTADFIAFWSIQWPVIVLLLYSFMPITCLIGCSIILLRELNFRNNSDNSAENNILRIEFTHQKKYYKSITKMLISVCIFFVIISVPICTYLIIEPYIFDDTSPQDMAKRILAWAFVALVLYCNNAFNFILYCVSGSLFRKELLQMLLDLQHKALRCRERRIYPGDDRTFRGSSRERSPWTSNS